MALQHQMVSEPESNEEEIVKLLQANWEPFAAVLDFEGEVKIYFRRQVSVETDPKGTDVQS